MAFTSRRRFLHGLTIAAAAGALRVPTAAAADATQAATGCITTNDPAGYLRFSQFLGRRPALALLYFNQMGPDALWDSVPYICQQAASFIAAGAQVLWSVPCPGARQLEAIVAGTWDSQYRKLFASILAAEPAGDRAILLRLPWEFNLPQQENAAIDKDGAFDATLFVKAFQRLSDLARQVSPRFRRIWCPNVCTHGVDPLLCWPGTDYVEVVSQDVYMQTAYDKPGGLDWFLNESRGLLRGLDFAKSHGLGYGLSEWGMDSDAFAGDLSRVSAWLKTMGSTLDHHCWWDRSEVIDCRISDGTHPGLAAAYRQAWA